MPGIDPNKWQRVIKPWGNQPLHERVDMSILLLRIHGIATEGEADKMRQRLKKQINKAKDSK